jgi:hypothetical protein
MILIGLAGAALAACSPGKPDLQLDQPALELGQVVNGEVRTFEVALLNAGDGELVIEAVSTSCGCTSAQAIPTTLGPGERGVLQVTFDSGAHGPEEHGPVMRQVFIASNDPDQPELEFRFSADILPPET